jgi:hypothetical protein
MKRLLDHYYKIGEGIGVHKSPNHYGAFSTDPYSHTPEHKGAQQPGMTGQVKEDILVSIGELGIEVVNGNIQFNPVLLRSTEFSTNAKSVAFVDVHQNTRTLQLPAESLAFTYCQVPIVYQKYAHDRIVFTTADGVATELDGLVLDEAHSKDVFMRSGNVMKIVVQITEAHLH